MRGQNGKRGIGIAKLAVAVSMVTAVVTVASAKTIEDCNRQHDSMVSACYSTDVMLTATQMKYCLQRAENRYSNCLTGVVDAISGAALQRDPGGPPPKRPRRPEVHSTPGLLEQSPGLPTQGPAATGQPSVILK
jgi:hypothetical protein